MIDALRTPILALPAPGAQSRREQARSSQCQEPGSGQTTWPSRVAQVAAAMPPRNRARRPDAAFLAQVIATAEGVPQTRARRQCSAREGTCAYAAVARLVASP